MGDGVIGGEEGGRGGESQPAVPEYKVERVDRTLCDWDWMDILAIVCQLLARCLRHKNARPTNFVRFCFVTELCGTFNSSMRV